MSSGPVGRTDVRQRGRLDPEVKRFLWQTALGVVLVVGAVFALGLVFREPLERAGAELVERFGYLGIAVGILAADMLTFPLPADVYLLFGVAAHADPVGIIVAGSLASMVGGVGAYQIGRWLGEWRPVAIRLRRLRGRYDRLIQRLGVVAVVVAALTPVPFSIVCMGAGSLRVAFGPFLLAILCRIPRIAGYYGLIYLGWSV